MERRPTGGIAGVGFQTGPRVIALQRPVGKATVKIWIGDKVRTAHPALATVIHVDGQGPTAAKHSTWNHIRKNAPANVEWGWKNFIDEDVPMLNTTETWKQVKPRPGLITYQ